MSHRTAELRSLELHRRIAAAIEADPAVVDRATERVDSWLADGGPVPARWAERWRALLAGPRSELLAMLTTDTQACTDLRQVTPFAGAIPPRERQQIIRDIRREAG